MIDDDYVSVTLEDYLFSVSTPNFGKLSPSRVIIIFLFLGLISSTDDTLVRLIFRSCCCSSFSLETDIFKRNYPQYHRRQFLQFWNEEQIKLENT